VRPPTPQPDFLVLTAHRDLERVIWQWTLQRFGLISKDQ
jgi:hypothetical protein